MLAFNPFSTAETHGFFEDEEGWHGMAQKITTVMFQLNEVDFKTENGELNGVVSNLEKINTARWTISDPRSFAQLGADAMIRQVFEMYDGAISALIFFLVAS